MRANAQSALGMVAEIMASNAQLYYQLSGGIWINDNPAILAYFFNTGKSKVEESAASRRLASQEFGQVVILEVSVNPMARWVNSNLTRFTEFQTAVKPPPAFFARAEAN